MKTELSPEVKQMISKFVQIQRLKYGPDWKNILAAEMAAKTAPVVEKLLVLRDQVRK